MLKPDYPVRTPRLALRPFTAGDLDALHDFHRLPEVTRYLAPADIENCFDLGYHLRHLDTIYARVGLASDARPS